MTDSETKTVGVDGSDDTKNTDDTKDYSKDVRKIETEFADYLNRLESQSHVSDKMIKETVNFLNGFNTLRKVYSNARDDGLKCIEVLMDYGKKSWLNRGHVEYEGGIDAVHDFLQNYSSDTEVVISCFLFFDMMSHEEKVSKSIGIIVEFLKKHSENVKIQVFGINIISSGYYHSNIAQEEIRKQPGIVELVTKRMLEHPYTYDIQESCLKCLTFMCADSLDKNHREQAKEYGIFGAVVNVLHHREIFQDLQHYAVDLLCYLLEEDPFGIVWEMEEPVFDVIYKLVDFIFTNCKTGHRHD